MGMDPSGRRGGWRVIALVAAVVLLALGAAAASCSGPGEEAERPIGVGRSRVRPASGPSAEDVAALTSTTSAATAPSSTAPQADPGASTSPAGAGPTGESPDADSEATGSVVPLGADDCASVEQVVIPAATIVSDDDFIPLAEREPSPGTGAPLSAIRRVVQVVPEEDRPIWQAVAAEADRIVAEQRIPTDAERAHLQAARDASEVWARTACPDAPPSWRCDVYGSIGPGPDVAPTRAEAASPGAVLRRYPDTGGSVVLQQALDIVLYGWVDDIGFVTRTQQVERVGGGWATARRHACQSDP